MQAWALFFGERNHRPSRRMVVPRPQRSVVQRSPSVVTLSKQGMTHHPLREGRVSRTHKYLCALLELSHVMRDGIPGTEHRVFFFGESTAAC